MGNGSIAALLLTTECIVTDIKEPEAPAPMPNPGMDGSYRSIVESG